MAAPTMQLVPVPPPGERSDEELMIACAAGSRGAFASLVERYLPRTTSYCARVTGDPRAAEELAQDVLLAIWRTRGTYRPERPFRVLLFTIARNRCRNHARSWRRRLRWLGIATAPDGLAEVPTRDTSQLDELLAVERQREVRTALGELSSRDREVVLLRFEQDLSYAEIAVVTGRAEATVRGRVFHALRKLQLALGGGAA